MAKSKKKSSSGSSSKARQQVRKEVINQVRFLLTGVVFLFILVSTFNLGGSVGGFLFNTWRSLIGEATPAVAALLVWFALRRMFPKAFKYRGITITGLLLLLICVTAIFTRFEIGVGGGALGNGTYGLLSGMLGGLTALVLTFIVGAISLLLIFDQAAGNILSAFLKDAPEEEPQDDEESTAKVAVLGEIQPNPVNRFRQRLLRPETVTAPQSGKPTQVPVMRFSANWNYPPLDLLSRIDSKPQAGNIQKRMEIIKKTLSDFGVEVTHTG